MPVHVFVGLGVDRDGRPARVIRHWAGHPVARGIALFATRTTAKLWQMLPLVHHLCCNFVIAHDKRFVEVVLELTGAVTGDHKVS